ncbi:MAG: hypothetical protein O2909_07355 [Chloroflexi bacterium]|nr:hypothetical protein [Chloroflexota bacterium]PKB57595.1 MAG: hypothetical protein BZY73_02490 [SAR202 cluster bacterium Casp-Chloro-G3]
MTESKMLELAEEVLAQSKAGKVKWEEITNTDAYGVKFPDIGLGIVRISGAEYLLQLRDIGGKLLDSLSGRRGSEEYNMLQEIYNLARGEALSVEENIDKALNYLKGQ